MGASRHFAPDTRVSPTRSQIGTARSGEPAVILPTVEQIERIHQEAHHEGHALGTRLVGHEAGYEPAASGRQWRPQVARSAQRFQRALAKADQRIGNDLLALALDFARQMVREALRVKPELVFAVVRENIRSESAFSQPPQLYLHPEDAALVREHLNHELNDCKSASTPNWSAAIAGSRPATARSMPRSRPAGSDRAGAGTE